MNPPSKRTRSVSPIMQNIGELSTPDGSRVTRSLSVEASDEPNKRRKKTGNQRKMQKAEREALKKQRLEELDRVEKEVREGDSGEYMLLLQNIEKKRDKKLKIIEAKRKLAEKSVKKLFTSQKDIANAQYFWDKIDLQRSMIQHLRQQIDDLEQEYYTSHSQSSLDEEHLTEWLPPDRPTMISSLTLGLSQDEAEDDVALARQDPERTSSPVLDMLVSLADRQYQKDFNQQQQYHYYH